MKRFISMSSAFALLALASGLRVSGQSVPTLVDSNLMVRTVVEELNTPTTMAFIGDDDILVLEKGTGQVRRITDGEIQPTPVLDLAVNSASERGLLGIALHPDFPDEPAVYLYWTESSTGADSTNLADVPILGNRVDRFSWDGSTLTIETNIIHLRALQEDAGQPPRGNHDGGILKFGPDGKLYIFMGDNGRRGQMQNLPDGPGAAGLPDDQFGGPEPDDAHLTGVILRLNDDGSTPEDNPFFRAGALRGGEDGENLQKVFAYGVRNGFGMAFDPFSGHLWDAQNGDDSFSELNLVERGANLGWVQVMGPLARIEQFKAIETSSNFFGLQQVRWSPTNIANNAFDAMLRMFNVFEGGNRFAALLRGGNENPPVETTASAFASFELNDDGTLSYELRALSAIENATQAHIHLGARDRNGPVVAFLMPLDTNGVDFAAGDLIAEGVISDTNVIARTNFTPSVSNLVQRLRQGRAYANLHTIDHPGGEIRGQVTVSDRRPVSHYSDPEFSWKYEVAPAAVGFISSKNLGPQYRGDMIIGAARPTIQGGHLFRMQLAGNRRKIAVDDPRLRDRVADNLDKFELTESETLLFGTGFGVGTDIQTGPNGNLYIVSLSNGAIYEISGKPKASHGKKTVSNRGRH
jgi:glucose/arabinose dehydrogenase